MHRIIQNIIEKIIYNLKARHHKGFGIHSPYLYHLISFVLEERSPYYCYDQIESTRKLFKKDIKSFHRSDKIDTRCGQLLFRLIQDAQFKNLLEIGTSAGFETQYMAFANQKARGITIALSAELTETVQKFQEFNKKLGLKNIELRTLKPHDTTEKIINGLDSLDFVYFNECTGNLKVIDLFEQCFSKINNGSIFVLNKIHINSEKKNAWAKIRMYPEVSVTIDLYDIGIVIFNPELEKNNYIIRL